MIQRPRIPVPEKDAAERITSFAEVDGVLAKDDAYEGSEALPALLSHLFDRDREVVDERDGTNRKRQKPFAGDHHVRKDQRP